MIKFILILGGVFLAILYFAYIRRTLLDRLLVLTALGFTVYFVLNPDKTSALSQRIFGVGRGADLLVYLYVPFSLYLILLLFIRMRENERNLTHVVRNLALHQARRAPEPAPPAASFSTGAES